QLQSTDIVIYSSHKLLEEILGRASITRLFRFPTITNLAEMQDCVYVGEKKDMVSAVGGYHSFIVLCSFLFGLDESTCFKMFNSELYRSLGYFDLVKQGNELFKTKLVHFGCADT